MNTSYLIAGTVALAATGWILSGQVTDPGQSAHADVKKSAEPAIEQQLKKVRVRSVGSRPWRREVIIRGKTEASRSVKMRAETASRIAKVLVREGMRVKKGKSLILLDPAERTAALAEARALLQQRAVEYKAARSLAAKGYRSDTKLAEARAHLDAARARVSQMNTDMARTDIVAPFDGLLEKRFVEEGDYVKIGDDVARFVDLDPIHVVGAVSEREVGTIKVGAAAKVTLVNGRTLRGVIRFIGAVADEATRTFRVEVVIPNADGAIRDGITSVVNIFSAEIQAHFLPPSLLTLDSSGSIGIKTVDGENRVVFYPVKILADKQDGIWVGGLPETINLITVGQEFVRTGQRVTPVPEKTESAS
jgi:multidrug efflux system membrane fusion protein